MFRHQTVCNARDCAATLNDIVTNLDEGVVIKERPSIIRLEHNDDLLITYYEDRPTFVEATESGAPCAITDAARDMPVTSAEATIPVTQESGTPAPDNYLAFTGYTELTLTHDDGEGGSEETFSFAFPAAAGIVYGGTLDAITGELTVTHYFKEFDGGEPWYISWPDTLPAFYTFLANDPDSASSTGVFSLFKYVNIWSGGGYGAEIEQSTATRCYVRYADQPETVDEWKERLATWKEAGAPLQVVYEMATPVKYQLDPVAMQTVRGANTFTSSLESTVAVGYWADPLLSE